MHNQIPKTVSERFFGVNFAKGFSKSLMIRNSLIYARILRHFTKLVNGWFVISFEISIDFGLKVIG